jgi:hypothetical protein
MKLKVPYFEQNKLNNCGANSLKMVLSYFNKDYDISELEEMCEIKQGKGLNSASITLAVRKAGFNCDFYSSSMSVNPDNYNLDFYKKYSEEIESVNEIIKRTIELGVNQFEKTINLEKITSLINEKSVPIILLDWSVINNNNKGYQGHFVPIVGFDEKFIYVHTGQDNQKGFPIEIEVFEKARKAKGTDEDFIVVYTN